MVVAAGGDAVFAHGRAAEFAAPDHQRILEEPARFQVLHEGGLGLVHLAAAFLEIALEVFFRAAMAVPIRVIQLHKPGAALDEAAREEAVPAEGGPVVFDTVEFEGGGAFLTEVDELRGARLHAARHLVGGDAGGDLGVAGLDGAREVEVADGVDGLALAAGRDAGGISQVKDWLAAAAQGHALKRRGQKTAAPVHAAAAGTARTRLQDDEAGEVLRLATEAVGDPGAHARAAELAGARVHEKFRRRMIEELGGAGFDDRDIVDDAGGVGEKVGHPRSALAVLFEFAP